CALRRRHTRSKRVWSSGVCSSDLGVLSLLLWNLVADELLPLLNNSGFYAIGYADGLVILLTGNHESMLCEIMQTALRMVEKWCQDRKSVVLGKERGTETRRGHCE